MNSFRLLAALILSLAFSAPVAAKLYKWVDSNGVTHYGETVPPEFADKNRSELKAGRVIKTEEVLSPEESRAKKASEQKKREDEKLALERKRLDLTLTSTYSNVEEIDLARNRSLQHVDSRINSVNSQLKMSKNTLQGLQSEVDGYTKANKPIPASLNEDLQETQSRLGRLQQTMEKLEKEKTSVESRYASDKARYKELTGK